jgi:thioredoxin reductase
LVDVAIVGAGPYGLSLAAHLRDRGISYRIFGKPMDFWLTQMPKGMHLKSDGFASNLYDPQGLHTLQRFCHERNLEYADRNFAIPLETFTDYGLEFQRKLVPDVERNMVVALDRANDGFTLRLDNDEVVRAKNVVLAIGISSFQHVPACLADLPDQFLTHSSRHHDLAPFRNRRVAVIGGGASAIDLAALLHEAGADVRLIARVPKLYIHDKGSDTRTLWEQVTRPISGIGPGWRACFLCYAPWMFHRLPQDLRLEVVRKTLGPAGGWFMKDRILGRVPLMLGQTPERAEIQGQGVRLHLRGADGSERDISTDHIIAATGYKVDIGRLQFLSSEIRSKMATVENTPILTRKMESSIPGLYFLGVAAANSFGPLMRFACGAGFTSRLLTARVEAHTGVGLPAR